MTIEAQLDKLIEINQALLTHFQSQAAMGSAAFVAGGDDTGAEKPTRARRTKKQMEEDAAAEAAAAPAADAAAKNEQVASATTTQAPAPTAPSATAQADTASASQTPVEWKDVIAGFTKMIGDPNHGRPAVLEVMKKFDPNATTIPALEALGKNAEIVAHIDALLNPKAAAEEDPLASLGL